MKAHLFIASALVALVVSGCGQKDTSATAPAAASSGMREVEITAGDNMKYNLSVIEAKPGEQIKVSLTNTGALPIEAMAHNWVLLKAGSDAAAFATAALTAKDQGYVPTALAGEVLAHIDLTGPHATNSVVVTVPAQPGDYPFLCTFPAHYLAGMKGVLTVK